LPGDEPQIMVRPYRGGSMTGTLRPGDHLVVVAMSLADIRPGDVVVYRSLDNEGNSETIAHRVMAVRPSGFVTQGDNNPWRDTVSLTAGNLLGRVVRIERDGVSHPVYGGVPCLLWAWVLRVRRRAYHLLARLGRRPYLWLRDRRVLWRLWQPPLTKIRIETPDGPVVKYLYGGRTVARWWQVGNRFECRKPYDLFVGPPA